MTIKPVDIVKIRKDNGLTQKQLAEKLGVTSRTIINWEQGEPISKTAEILLAALSKKQVNVTPNNEGDGIPMLAGVHTTGSVTHLFKDEHDEKPLFYLDAPEIKGCDYGVRVIGDSMYPLIRNGGYVACKTINNKDHILYGEIFHVITNDYSTVKYVKPHPKKQDWVMLVPYNESIDPTPLPKSEILKLAQVRAILQVI